MAASPALDPPLHACSICERREATWVHRLDPQRAHFAVYGKDHVWGGPVWLCGGREALLTEGDVDGLVAASPHAWETDRDIDECVRHGLVALHRADLSAVSLAEWLPPGYQELVAHGFLPIDELTGATQVVQAWPDADRRSVPETRPGRAGEDGLCWFVRSPWPSLDVREVLTVMCARLEAARRTPDVHDARRELDVVRDLFRHDDTWIRNYRDLQA